MASAAFLDAMQTLTYFPDVASPFLLSSSFHSFLVCCSSSLSTSLSFSLSSSISAMSSSMESFSPTSHPSVKDAAAPPIPRTTSYPRSTPKTFPLKHIHRRQRVGSGGGCEGGDGDELGFGYDEGFGYFGKFGDFGNFGDIADLGGFGGFGGFGGDGGNGGGDGWRWHAWGDGWNDEWRRSNGRKDNTVLLIYQLACWLSFTGCVHHVIRKSGFVERKMRRGRARAAAGGGEGTRGNSLDESLTENSLALCGRPILASSGHRNGSEVIAC